MTSDGLWLLHRQKLRGHTVVVACAAADAAEGAGNLILQSGQQSARRAKSVVCSHNQIVRAGAEVAELVLIVADDQVTEAGKRSSPTAAEKGRGVVVGRARTVADMDIRAG